MKVLIFLCIVGAAIYSVQADLTPEATEEYHKLRDECMGKSGATIEMVEDAEKRHIYADDDKMGAFTRCMFEKNGFMDHDGTMHPDVMIQKATRTKTEEQAKTLVNKCIEKTKDMDNLEKRCYQFVKCYKGDSSS